MEATVISLAAQVESLEGTVKKILREKSDAPVPSPAATGGWGLRGLHFWAALAAVVTAATASAVWLYA